MYKIEILAIGTKFSIGASKYELDNACWSIKAPTFPVTDVVGNGESESVKSCHPILGGQVQTKIKKWIRIDATVYVS